MPLLQQMTGDLYGRMSGQYLDDLGATFAYKVLAKGKTEKSKMRKDLIETFVKLGLERNKVTFVIFTPINCLLQAAGFL